MPPSALPTSKRSAITSGALQHSHHCPKGRPGTDERLNCNWPGACCYSQPKGSLRSRQQGDSRQQFMAVYGLWQSANGAGMIRECRRLSDRLLQLTAGNADEGLHLQAHHSAWATGMFAGEPAAAREHSEAGRRLYDPERHRSHHQHYGGHDPGVCASSIGALVHWLLGYPDKGLTIGNEALALAERLAHPFSLELAL